MLDLIVLCTVRKKLEARVEEQKNREKVLQAFKEDRERRLEKK